jgi:hypothetical protein
VRITSTGQPTEPSATESRKISADPRQRATSCCIRTLDWIYPYKVVDNTSIGWGCCPLTYARLLMMICKLTDTEIRAQRKYA